MENKTPLESFQWDPEPSFLEEVEVEQKEEKAEKEEKDIKEKEIEPEDDDVFFDNIKEETLKTLNETPATKVDSIYNDVYEDLRKEGILKFAEIEEGEVLDSASFYELQRQEYEAAVNEKLQEYSEDLDDDAKAFLRFKKEGGKTQDFLNAYIGNKEFDLEGDIYDEEYQDYIIRKKLEKEDWESDVIEDTLRTLDENGQKKKQAEKFLQKFQKEEEGKKEILFKELEQKKQYEKQQEDAFNSNLKTIIKNTPEVNGFRFDSKEQDIIYDLLVNKKHKISQTESITDFQKLLGEALSNIPKTLILAKLLNNNFDISFLKKDIKNEKVKEIKSNLEQRKSYKTNTLNDFF